MADNTPVTAQTVLRTNYWRCCFDLADPPHGQEWPKENCLPNNIATDYVEGHIHFIQDFNRNPSAGANYDLDTYYVDVYLKFSGNTEWQKHTHTVTNWEWAVQPVIGPINGNFIRGIRTGYVRCRNVLNGIYKCNEEQVYKIAIHAYVMRKGVGQVTIIQRGTIGGQPGGGRDSDWRWCEDFYAIQEFQSGQGKLGDPNKQARDGAFCRKGYQVIRLSKCTKEADIPAPYGCGPFGLTGKVQLKDDWIDPAFSGTMGPRGVGRAIGPPDSVMNAVVMGGVPDMPYVDVDLTGPEAGWGANYWEGTNYNLAPFGDGILIDGAWYPQGANGDPDGCPSCPGAGDPDVPPTGTGCGTCTFYWDEGVSAWTEHSYSVACGGANCQCPPEPGWPAGSVHGETKVTGCITGV